MEVEAQPSGLGWLPGGDLLVVSMKDRRVLRRAADGSVSVHADVSALASGHLNDMVVDRQGRAYAGNFGFDLMGGGHPATAAVVRIDPDGRAVVAAEDLWFPNGTVITDDGTLIVAETMAARLTAFTIQPDGTFADRRVWAQIEPTPEPADIATMFGAITFAPDGCALDAEGHVWVANALGGPLSRIAPGGQIVDELAIPAGLAVFACGLGGEDGRTLMACAAPDFHEDARKAAREGGAAERDRRSPARGPPLGRRAQPRRPRWVTRRLQPARRSHAPRPERRCGTIACSPVVVTRRSSPWPRSLSPRSPARRRRPSAGSARSRRRSPTATRRRPRRSSPPTATGATSSPSRGTSRPWRGARASPTWSSTTAGQTGAHGFRVTEPAAEADGVTEAWIAFETEVGRGQRASAPEGGQGLDAADHARRAQGPRGAPRAGPAARCRARRRARSRELARAAPARGRGARGHAHSPTSSSSAAGRAGSGWARGCASSASRPSSSTVTRGPATSGAAATSRSASTTRSGTTTCPTSSSPRTGPCSRRRTRSATGWRCTRG